LHKKKLDINAAVWEVQEQDINAAAWEVQEQHINAAVWEIQAQDINASVWEVQAQDINAAVWEVQAQDINAAVWEVQAQDSASSDSRTALHLYNPGTNSALQSLRLRNPTINSAMLKHPTRTSALVLEFPVVPARQKVHNPEPSMRKDNPSRLQPCDLPAGKLAMGEGRLLCHVCKLRCGLQAFLSSWTLAP
jgi:hypothetical protein